MKNRVPIDVKNRLHILQNHVKRKAANKAKSSSSTIQSRSVLETSTINTSSAVDAKVNKANISSFMDSENVYQLRSELQMQSSSSSNNASSLFPSTHSHEYVQDLELLSQPITEYRNSSNSSSSEPGNPNITSTNTNEGNLLYSNKHVNQSHMASSGPSRSVPYFSSNTNTHKTSIFENNSSGTYNGTHPEHISSAIPYFNNSNSSSSSIPNYNIQINFDPVSYNQYIAPYRYHDNRYATYNAASSNVPNDSTNNIYAGNTSYKSNSNIYSNLSDPMPTSLPNTSSSDIVSNILYQHPTPGSVFSKYYDDEIQKSKKKKSEKP